MSARDDFREDPVRWTDASSDDPLERRAGELLRLPPPPPLGPIRSTRIEMRLTAGAGPSLRLRLGYGLVGIVGALAVAGGVVAAVGVGTRRSHDPEIAPPDEVARSRPHVGAADSPVPSEEPAVAPPALVPPPAAEAARPARHHQKAHVASAPAQRGSEPPAPAVSEPGPLSEPRLLAEARARLQAGRDARGALALVAEHQRRFPRGALALEARITEVEALVALGRRPEALAVLDLLSLDKLPRAAEVGVLRAELRAEAGRPGDAIADFTPCADGDRCRPETEERALYGRASCRERVGQRAGARADLQRYLARFPRGRFAAAVRASLNAH